MEYMNNTNQSPFIVSPKKIPINNTNDTTDNKSFTQKRYSNNDDYNQMIILCSVSV